MTCHVTKDEKVTNNIVWAQKVCASYNTKHLADGHSDTICIRWSQVYLVGIYTITHTLIVRRCPVVKQQWSHVDLVGSLLKKHK